MSDDYEPNALERASAPWLVRLSAVPRWLFIVALAGTLLVGLFLTNVVGACLLLLLALFLGWLAAIGWRAQTPMGKVLRVVTVGLLVWAGVTRLF